MSRLDPLRFEPINQCRLWGGRRSVDAQWPQLSGSQIEYRPGKYLDIKPRDARRGSESVTREHAQYQFV
ncbi:MAG: hypothetical protein ABI604_11350 [Nitrospirota bacterium]